MGMPVSIHLRGDGRRDRRGRRPRSRRSSTSCAPSTCSSRPTGRTARSAAIDRGELAVDRRAPAGRARSSTCARRPRALTGGVFDAWRPVAGGARDDALRPDRAWSRAGRCSGPPTTSAPACGATSAVNAGGDVAAPGRGAGRAAAVAGRDRGPGRPDPGPRRPPAGLRRGGHLRHGAPRPAPRRPADRAAVTAVLSVTVTGPSLLWADVLATAAFVARAGALDRGRGRSPATRRSWSRRTAA